MYNVDGEELPGFPGTSSWYYATMHLTLRHSGLRQAGEGGGLLREYAWVADVDRVCDVVRGTA